MTHLPPGTATVGMLNPGDIYQVTITQDGYAGTWHMQTVPDPGSLAVLGVGLTAMAALCRRRCA